MRPAERSCSMSGFEGKTGASFIWEDHKAEEIFTSENLSEEQRLFMKTASEFVDKEITPRTEEIEEKKEGVAKELMQKAGELGLLMVDIPESAGGLGLDKVTSLAVTEAMGHAGSFAATQGAHVGIGSWTIVFFGNEEQQAKYLPKLASGESIAAYSLTEANSGSDALAARTKAVLSEDGKHYILNGEKTFITNGGWADVFTVFAKVDGEHFTAFIVERGFEGISLGAEEKKMGIKGSSTCSLYLENAKVPIENVLGEIGRGHVIAFNVLNLGRFKLASAAIGVSKHMLAISAKYANERKQFGQPISGFGAIKAKLADMAINIFTEEAMAYRTGGNVDAMLDSLDKDAPDYNKKAMQSIESFVVECSITKVHGSEMMGRVADEAVQIHGGYGFIEEYAVARFYRDARINRIFEGTNEINRLLIPGTLMKKAMKGQIPLMEKNQEAVEFVMGGKTIASEGGPLGDALALAQNAKKLFLFTLAQAVQKYMQDITNEQNVLMWLADILIETLACESAVLRAQKLVIEKGENGAALPIAMANTYVNDAVGMIRHSAEQVLARVCDKDTLEAMLDAVARLTKWTPLDTAETRETIVAVIIDKEKYALA